MQPPPDPTPSSKGILMDPRSLVVGLVVIGLFGVAAYLVAG